MCEHHADGEELLLPPVEPRRNEYGEGLSRRSFLAVGSAVAAGLAVGAGARPASAAGAGATTSSAAGSGAAGPVRNASGLRSWRGAMHVHGSLSEMTGSAAAQVDQASRNGFDVLHLTEHDGRGFKHLFRTSYGFTPGELQFGGAWDVALAADIGRPVRPVGGLGTAPKPAGGGTPGSSGALRIGLVAPPAATASRCYRLVNGFTAGDTGTRANWNGSIVGDLLSVRVLAATSGRDAWGDLYVSLSHHPATGGVPAGIRRLHYRMRSDITDRSHQARGLVGLIDVPVTAGVWTGLVLDLVADAAAVWPTGGDPRDNALTSTEFWATARNGATCEVYFAALERMPQGEYDPVGLQRSLLDGLATTAPALASYPGLEYSVDDHVHINGFGGTPGWFGYDSLSDSSRRPLYPDYGSALTPALVAWIQAGGGLASLNHLFGYALHDTRTQAAQTTRTRQLTTSLLSGGVGGADLIEVGYRQRGGYTLEHHLQLFDALIRNGVWVTGNGTSDDHTGVDWDLQTNSAYTSTWAPSAALPDQLAALSAGRAFVGFLDAFTGTLDLRLDNGPMGSVSVSTARRRQLHIDLTGLPPGGAVEIVKIDVDYAGATDPTSGSTVVHRLGATALANPTLQVNTSTSTAFRANVLDANGQIVAFSQPCWTLTDRPPTPIPTGRAAPGTLPG